MNGIILRSLTVLAVLTAVSPAISHRAAAATAPVKWCAPARPQEPLLSDAIRIGTANDAQSVRNRKMYRIGQVEREAIVVIRDESTCRQAANAYGGILRKSVDPKIIDKPVLVIKVADVYFVDDLRSRKGRDAYWEAMIFDAQWHRLSGYGAGANIPEAREAPRSNLSQR
jgi:hypothetical protein